jgi:hypothetical protein
LRAIIASRGDFDHYLASDYRRPPYPERLEFVVVDSNGQELGRESLRLLPQSGGEYRVFP